MLYLDDIKVEFESQGFKGTHLGISPEKDKTVMFMESVRSTHSVHCPFCGGSDTVTNGQPVKVMDMETGRTVDYTNGGVCYERT